MADMQWTGRDEVRRRIEAYGKECVRIARQFALSWAPRLEAHAKQNAVWTDRTANARQSLHAYLGDDPPEKYSAEGAEPYPTPEQVAADVVTIFLSHGMEYGLALETKYSGRYAIIWPTIEALLPQMRREWETIFS